jgi:polysaccharide deacetylase family protein (PEP-CTERM system associated)
MTEALFSVDLEDFRFVARRLAGLPDGDDPAAVERGVEQILAALEKSAPGSKLTFFTNARVAETLPGLVRSLSAQGHEIACHSYAHRKLDTISRREFAEDLHRATSLLEDLSGAAVRGYRAPSFSLSPASGWALECLYERGYRYDSSLLAAERGPKCGDGDVLQLQSGRLLEFPLFLYRPFPGIRIRAVGGSYFRFLPAAAVVRIIELSRARGFLPVLWLHPADCVPGRIPILFSEARQRGLSSALRWPVDECSRRWGCSEAASKLAEVLGCLQLRGRMGDLAADFSAEQAL